MVTLAGCVKKNLLTYWHFPSLAQLSVSKHFCNYFLEHFFCNSRKTKFLHAESDTQDVECEMKLWTPSNVRRRKYEEEKV